MLSVIIPAKNEIYLEKMSHLLSRMITLICINPSAQDTSSSFSVISPFLIRFFRQKMTSIAIFLVKVNGWGAISSESICSLCSKFQVGWITAGSVVANYMVKNKVSFSFRNWFNHPSVYQSMHGFSLSSKVKNTISSILYFSTCPVPTSCIFINRNLRKYSLLFANCKFNYKIFNHVIIIPHVELI